MNMYVSNLGMDIGNDQLKTMFEEFGVVSTAKIILDRETGKSRGFGFVDMSSDTEARTAMTALNGQDMEGRKLNVTIARERESR